MIGVLRFHSIKPCPQQKFVETWSSRYSNAEIMVTIFIKGKNGPVGPGRINMRSKDIALNVLLQDNGMSAQVP